LNLLFKFGEQPFDSPVRLYVHNVYLKTADENMREEPTMIDVTPLRIEDKNAVGLRVELPDSPPLVLIIGRTGFVGCGFINIEAAEKLNVAAVSVSGVKTFDDVLNAEIKAATSKAQAQGVKMGMKGKDAVKAFL